MNYDTQYVENIPEDKLNQVRLPKADIKETSTEYQNSDMNSDSEASETVNDYENQIDIHLLKKDAEITTTQGNKNSDIVDLDQKYCTILYGKITYVDEARQLFTVRLENSPNDFIREGNFSFDDVDAADQKLIKIDSRIIFIYGKQYINRTLYNFSKIYIRKQMCWTKHEIKKIKESADKLYEALKKNDEFSEG